MAKKFNLAELMGEAVSKSNTGEMRVEQIPMAEIEENENNSYAQTGIDELAESIKVIGLQQPLVVRRKTEGGYCCSPDIAAGMHWRCSTARPHPVSCLTLTLTRPSRR
jgi:hypothetical protein